MRSTSGQYFEKLDHIRAVAAFLVFTWHFTHAAGVPFSYVPANPFFSILEEGHTGVAIFMTLSGYLFAKIIDGRPIAYTIFLWNRLVRLGPLLVVVLTVAYGGKVLYLGASIINVTSDFISGFVFPVWPNGGWSIAVELHFYLILPLLLSILLRSSWMALLLIIGAIVIRLQNYLIGFPIETFAYWTLVGRVDQFVLGIVGWNLVKLRTVPVPVAVLALVGMIGALHWLNLKGGFYGTEFDSLWIIVPTIEGVCYATLIAWYDRCPKRLPRLLSRPLAIIGTVSYSIYLLHFFIVFDVGAVVGPWLVGLSFGWVIGCSIVAFLLLVPLAWLSYGLIEKPFMRLRRSYAGQYPSRLASAETLDGSIRRYSWRPVVPRRLDIPDRDNL